MELESQLLNETCDFNSTLIRFT